jgi:hypothetical protein
LRDSIRFEMGDKLSLSASCCMRVCVLLYCRALSVDIEDRAMDKKPTKKTIRSFLPRSRHQVGSMFSFCVSAKRKRDFLLYRRRMVTQLEKKMDSRGIEPRTTPRIEFEALCASEMLREYYTTKPRARD